MINMIKRGIILCLIIGAQLASIFSITLREAINHALESNKTFILYEIDNKILSSYKWSTVLNYIPDIQLIVNYEKQDIPIAEDDLLSRKQYESLINIDIPLPYLNKNRNLYKYYDYSSKIITNKIKLLKSEIIIKTMELYFSVLKNKELVSFWQDECQNANDRLIKAGIMVKSGSISEIDYLENLYYKNYVSYNLLKSENDFELSLMKLGEYINIDVSTVEDFKILVFRVESFEYYENMALRNNPEYNNISLNLELNKNLVKYYKKSKYPEISFFIQQESSGDRLFNFHKGDLIFGLKIDLIDFLTTDSSYQYISTVNHQNQQMTWQLNALTGNEAKIELLNSYKELITAEENFTRMKDYLHYNVRTAYYNYINSKNNLELKEKKMKLQQNKMDMKLKKYSLGMIDDEEKVKAIQEFAQAKYEYLDMRYEYIMNYYKLLNATGIDIEI